MSDELECQPVETPPLESVRYVIASLTGGLTNKAKAARAVLCTLQYVSGQFLPGEGEAQAVALPMDATVKSVGKQKLVKCLESLCDDGEAGLVVPAAAIPPWLMPVLLDLLTRWLTSRK